MQKKQIIIIFNEKSEVIAFVELNPEISIEFTKNANENQISVLRNLVQSLSERMPRVRREVLEGDILSVNLETVKKSDSNYLSGILEEFKIAGFVAQIVPSVLKTLLIQVSEKLTQTQREAVLGEIVNFPHDIEEEALLEFQKIIDDFINLKQSL
jgi:hypothetical protein